MNLIDHIGNNVTVWTVEGNSMKNRKLITTDEMGIVVAPISGEHEVFVPWNRVKYVDLLKSNTMLKEWELSVDVNEENERDEADRD